MNKKCENGLKKWECPYGCDQVPLINNTGRYCSHLEAELPGINRGSKLPKDYVSFVKNGRESEETSEKKMIEAQLLRSLGEEELEAWNDKLLRSWLRTKGISTKQARAIVMKVSTDAVFREIAKCLGYSDASSAFRAYKSAIERLKKGLT